MNRLLIGVLLGFMACSPPDRWEDRGRGVERKWLGFDEGQGAVGTSIYSAISLELHTVEDPDLRCASELELTPKRLQSDTSYFLTRELFTLSSGDSLVYRLPAGMLSGDFYADVFANCPVDLLLNDVLLTVAVAALYDSSNYEQSPRHQRNLRRMEERELLYDALVLGGYEAEASEREWGWEVILNEGAGASARQGDELVLAYRGRYLDGRIFDDALQEENWLYFPWGKPDQVVRGLELALADMRPGERRLLWLTSDYAFGARGSKGIVGANTPVYFELQLVDILRGGDN